MANLANPPRPAITTNTNPEVKISTFDNQPENGAFFRSSVNLESLQNLVDSDSLSEDAYDPDCLRLGTDYGVLSPTQSYAIRPINCQVITFYSSPSNSLRRAASFKDIFTSAQNFHDIISRHRGYSIWWIDVQNPSDKTLRLLCSAFHVHPLTVEDIRMQETHEKMDHFPSYSFVCLRTFTVVMNESKISYEPQTIYMVMFKEGTLTFNFSKTQHNAHVLDRIAALHDYIAITRPWLFYAFV